MINKLIFVITIMFIPFWEMNLATESPKSETIETLLTYSEDWSFLSGVSTPFSIFGRMDDEYVKLPNGQNTSGFRCSAEHNLVRLDTDGDDNFDSEIKGKEDFVTYKIKYSDGGQLNYRMRIFNKSIVSGQSPMWFYQRACFLTAKTPIETFILIDDNNNGYFNDNGEDAVIIGTGNKQSIPLSSIIQVKGKFYTLKVERLQEIPEGSKKAANIVPVKLQLTPYRGSTGKIDFVKNLKPPKDLPQNIVIRRDNDVFFQWLGKGDAVIPAGEYYLVSAIFSKRIRARSSEKPLVVVEENKVASPKWGGPFRLHLNPYCEKGGGLTIVIPPAYLTAPQYTTKYMDCPFIKMKFPKVLGSSGEEYYATDEFKDEKGNAFPDGGVSFFNVEIRPKGSLTNQKPLNKGITPPADKWIPVDLSGLVEKAPPFWESYRCPIEKYRGIVLVKVWTSSSIFGDLSFEHEVEITE
jgi:hypothetical protein